MKGRKLPLGGSSRTRRANSEADHSLDQQSVAKTQESTSHVPEDSSVAQNSITSKPGENVNRKKPIGKSRLETTSRRGPKTRNSQELEPPGQGAPDEVTAEDSLSPDDLDKPVQSLKRQKPAPKIEAGDSRRLTGKRRLNESQSSEVKDVDVVASGDKAEENGKRRKRTQSSDINPRLYAIEEGNGRQTTVRLFVNGSIYIRSPSPSPESGRNGCPATPSHLGNDGNQYWCHVCHEFGDVVCCDGCPRVYHKNCIPKEDPARISLERDEDPWYCSECMKKHAMPSKPPPKPPTTRSEPEKMERRSKSHIRCVDCQQERQDLQILSCQECGNHVHHPSCIDDSNDDAGDVVLCSTCRAVDDLTKEEDNMREITERSIAEIRRAAARRGDDHAEDEKGHADADGGSHENGTDEPSVDNEAHRSRRRNRAGSISLDRQEKKKKRKKRKKLEAKVSQDGNDESPEEDKIEETYAALQRNSQPGRVEAIPAFYFYLAENRWKIERVLARKHRYFNRLPKGSERNELVAREAALWWVKMRAIDHRRYMTMSMRDFESRIIEWKEEKNIRDMYSDQVEAEETVVADHIVQNFTSEDERRALERHEKRFRTTSVGSKPFKPEVGHSYNRVLLDLLHDMRFHPYPMVGINRPQSVAVVDEHARATIPYFEVHGPISTSIGDECMGCSRGWRHFCPVLKRLLPAVEQRAKLQPPLSSLMATRIGLGLRPRLERRDEIQSEKSQLPDPAPGSLFSWKPSEEAEEIKHLPVVPSSSLGDAADRVDDIVLVIEETTAMRVKEPSLPLNPDQVHPSKGLLSRSLPTQRSKEQTDDSARVGTWHKCGRCRTLSESDMGCIQCRRAQLVINMTKKQPPGSEASPSSKGDGKALKVQTVMLGRVQMKEGSGETQAEGEHAIANAIMKQRWTPMVILPPQKALAPSPSRRMSEIEDEEHENDKSEEIVDPDAAEKTSQLQEEKEIAEKENLDSSKEAVGRQGSERGRTRQRPTRLLVSDQSTKDYNGPDRLKEQERQKKTDDLKVKCVAIACYGILLACLRRDPLKLFARAVGDEEYLETVEDPIDFSTIKDHVLKDQYATIEALIADVRQLCENALSFYPAQSVFWRTAKEINDHLPPIEKRARDWLLAVNSTYDDYLLRKDQLSDNASTTEDAFVDYPFSDLRQKWPEAAEMLERGPLLRNQIDTDLMRTKENETAYYGTLAIRRAAAAAAVSLAPYTDSCDEYALIVKRTDEADETLRQIVDNEVARISEPVQLGQVSSWREESLVRLLRKVQSRRMERRSMAESECSRCSKFDTNMSCALDEDMFHPEKKKKRGHDGSPRVDASRMYLTTGLASAKTCQRIVQREEAGPEKAQETVNDACVSVRASRIHGMGLFADQPFKKGDIVAEYVGEYMDEETADIREQKYREQRKQDYIFRLGDKVAIDATMKGGPARFINHNCEPNCFTSIVACEEPNEHMQRVLIVAQRDIVINEEITYDYRIPLELDLKARIPCNCQAEACRGFMNWDLPETGSNNRALLVHKRGANMRDRIRRLRRPLKRDES